MNAPAVLHTLDLLATAGIPVWLDGGWGVDALLGRVTRLHRDLDLILPQADLSRAVGLLVQNGFAVEEEELGRVVLLHAYHGRIDLHPVTFDPLGNGVQVQPAETPLVYPGEGFVTGHILDQPVGCISANVQIAVRLGYDRSDKHHRDLIALCSSFNLTIPEGWNEP
jgi:lincosamide nucleotidyltransferase A/C/D/E